MTVIVSGVFPSAHAPDPTRRALLIGVSDYSQGEADGGSWPNLNSATDVQAIRNVLVSKYRVEGRLVTVLTTVQETRRANILAAIRRLTDQTNPGDVVFLHFSGHGSQARDTDGDESDGMDETIVPSDHRRDGSTDIRDDELNHLLAALLARRPRQILVTFDSCHSGTAFRGARVSPRGHVRAGASPGRVNPDGSGPRRDSNGAFDRPGSPKPSPKHPTSLTVMSACRSDEKAYETNSPETGRMGLFSSALVRALTEAKADTSCRDLLERVTALMAARSAVQTPQLEGDADVLVMNGAAVPMERLLEVFVGDGRIQFTRLGYLQGVTPGSRFALYPAGTKVIGPSTRPLGEAEVVEVKPTQAFLRLVPGSPSVPVKALQSARARETHHSYGDNGLVVRLDPALRTDRWSDLCDRIQSLPLVARRTQEDRWDVRVRLQGVSADSELILERPDGTVLARVPSRHSPLPAIQDAIERESRWLFINRLQTPEGAGLRIHIRAVLVEVQTDADSRVTRVLSRRALPLDGGNQPQVAPNQHIMFEVRNDSPADAWVTILNLKADGSVGPVWPHPSATLSQENRVPGNKSGNPEGEWRLIPYPFVFRIDPLLGKDVYRAIATDRPADFSRLVDREGVERSRSRGEEIAGAADPIGRLLLAATMGERGVEAQTVVPTANWGTATTILHVQALAAPRRDENK